MKSVFILIYACILPNLLCGLEIEYPKQTEAALRFELRIQEQVVDGVPHQIFIFEDVEANEVFNADALPNHLRTGESTGSSFSMRGKFPDTLFFDWHSTPANSLYSSLDEDSVSNYADTLKASIESSEGWDVVISNRDSAFKFDYGKVIVHPPNREPYEIPKKPKLSPLGTDEYVIVDYTITQRLKEGESTPKKLEIYHFRDYLFNHGHYSFIFRVGIKQLDPTEYFITMDEFIRSILVGDGSFDL